MSRINDEVELTAEERAAAAATATPTKAMSALAKFKASQNEARKLGLLGKPVSMKGLTPREAIYKYAEDKDIPEEQRARYEALRDKTLVPVDALSESKQEALINTKMFIEDFVLSVAHERKLELQDRADNRANIALQAAEAKKAEAEAKLLAKQGGNTAPVGDLPTDPKAGTIPVQDESPIVTAAEINADVAADAEYQERERLLAEANSGTPKGKGKGKTIAPATEDAPASDAPVTPAV